MNKTITKSTKLEISEALKNKGIAKIVKRRKESSFIEYNERTGQIDFYNKYDLKKAENEDLGLEFRLYKSQLRRRDKIRDRISRMIQTNNCYFLTLTFSDKMFSRQATAETRRTYIRRFLKEQCLDYIANIDFGSKNAREHYHAVVVPKDRIDFTEYRKIFDSNINCKKVNQNQVSIKLVGKYIAKLTNHALKENGYYQRIMFARNR